MSFSLRQIAALGFVVLCLLVVALICIFAPVQVALVALAGLLVVCVAVVLVFLRKVLSAVYQIRDTQGNASPAAPLSGEAQDLITDMSVRLERLERSLPDRLAARVAFELSRETSAQRSASDAPAATTLED
ncbi:hypothetical protein [Leucobacter luti]|uniref:Uncharacterized protein n=1 Tax=Leucobacter luti TaxID=340320 RepID=A0A4Q7TTB6_9MICO|nr:hypothetical protein [Leucobacter luti]MBL3699740.1 hypothetical protein [Leucobacter luti]RZT62938.1 hypothetical protein EV139_2647 [Leucobacter luti]